MDNQLNLSEALQSAYNHRKFVNYKDGIVMRNTGNELIHKEDVVKDQPQLSMAVKWDYGQSDLVINQV